MLPPLMPPGPASWQAPPRLDLPRPLDVGGRAASRPGAGATSLAFGATAGRQRRARPVATGALYAITGAMYTAAARVERRPGPSSSGRRRVEARPAGTSGGGSGRKYFLRQNIFKYLQSLLQPGEHHQLLACPSPARPDRHARAAGRISDLPPNATATRPRARPCSLTRACKRVVAPGVCARWRWRTRHGRQTRRWASVCLSRARQPAAELWRTAGSRRGLGGERAPRSAGAAVLFVAQRGFAVGLEPGPMLRGDRRVGLLAAGDPGLHEPLLFVGGQLAGHG